MEIHNAGSGVLRTGYANAVRGGGIEGTTGATPVAPTSASSVSPGRSDKVQISEAGRALAAQAGDETSAAALSPERVSQIRQRVLEGAYNSVGVVEEIARRILDSGDI